MFLIPIILFCTSCRNENGNSNSSLTEYGSNAAMSSNEVETKLKDYFFNYFSVNDIGILADVTSDEIVDLITVKKDDDSICGNVYTLIGNEIQCLEEKTGTYYHAGGFFNWYLTENGSGYSLVEENQNMWQGIGACETIIYNLTNEGKRVVKDKITVTSDVPVSTEDFEEYQKNISNVIGESYDILHVASDAKNQPKTIKESLLIQTVDKPESSK